MSEERSLAPSPARKPRPRARPPLPRGPVLLDVVLIAAFLSLTFLLGAFPLKDTDFWWHLRTGDLIRQDGHVPQTDLYTFTVPEHRWIDLHWGYQVALSWGFAHGGVVALNLAKCAITCLALFVLITARRREWPIWVMLLAWLPALLVLGGRMYIRPETLTLLYLAIDLAILLRWDRFPVLAFLLPLVQVFWVNSQGLFVLGPILIAFAMIDALLRPGSLAQGRRRWWRIVGLATLLTGLACLVNPYGASGAVYPIELARTMGNPLFANTIAELMPVPVFIRQSVGFRSLPLQIHIATIVLGALSFLVPLFWSLAIRLRASTSGAVKDEAGRSTDRSRARGKTPGVTKKRGKAVADRAEPAWRLSPLRFLLFISFSALSWRATRNSHQFAAVVGTLTAWNFAEWAAAIRARDTGPRAGEDSVFPRLATLAAIVALFLLVASGKFYAMAGEGRTVGLGEEPLWFPHAAVKFAGQDTMPPRFLSFHDGYAPLYEYYHGPGRKVFADARLEVIGAELYDRYTKLSRAISENRPWWPRELDECGRPAILVGHQTHAVLGASILMNPDWRCVWFDPMVAVYIHKSYSEAAPARTVDFAARHFVHHPSTEPNGIPALLASAEALWKYASALQSQGRADMARPLVLLGLDHGRRIRQAAPESLDGWKILGKLELSRDPTDETPVQRFRLPFDPIFDLSAVRATYDLRHAHAIAPRDFLTLQLLIRLYASRGMHEEMRPLIGRLGRVVPINPIQAELVQGARTQSEQFPAHPGGPPPASWANLSELDKAVDSLLADGRALTAAEYLEPAYPLERRPWDVTDRLATLWLHLGEPARARRLWEQAATLPQPAAAVRSARVAVSHLVEGDFDTARRHYREALTAAPLLFEALYGLAILEQDDGRASDALDAARRAVDNAPGDAARSASRSILETVQPYAGGPVDRPRPQDRKKPENRLKNEDSIRR